MANADNSALVPAQTPQQRLALAERTSVGLQPRTFDEALMFSKMIANSDLAPKDFKGKPDNVLVAIQMGAEVGLAPMAAVQNIAVINGRPSLWGDAALAVVMNHRDYESHKEYQTGAGDERIAVCEIHRKGHEVHVSKFSVTDAKKANLWSKEGPWQTYPERMLKMRARGYAIRDKFPDALKGLGLAEEVMDIPEDRVIDVNEDVRERSIRRDDDLKRRMDESRKRLPANDARGDVQSLQRQIDEKRAAYEADQREQAKDLQKDIDAERAQREQNAKQPGDLTPVSDVIKRAGITEHLTGLKTKAVDKTEVGFGE